MVRVSVPQLTTPPIDLTGRDFETIKQSLIDFIAVRFPDLITELGDQSLLIALIELWAYEGDVINFYIDLQANETYLPTARQRNNVVKLANLVGYTPRQAAPSTVQLTATLSPALSSPVVIPKGTRIEINDGGNTIFFEVLEEVEIPALASTFVFPVTEGRTFLEEFTSSGAKFQKFRMSRDPVIIPSVVVKVDDVTWARVTAIPFSRVETNSAETYSTELSGDERASILFGDDVFSAIPANGAIVSIEYRVGGGVAGNLAVSAINTSIPAFIDGQTPTQLQVENLTAGSGGVDRETTDSIKLNAPLSTRSNDRLVTELDYKEIPLIFESEVGEVIRTRPEVLFASGRANEINVYAWTRGTGGVTVAAGSELLDALDSFVQERKMITIQHNVLAGNLQPINVTATISVLPGFNEAEVVDALEEDFQELFNSDEFQKLDFVRKFDLFTILCKAEGVQFADLITPTADIPLTPDEAAVIGALDIQTV